MQYSPYWPPWTVTRRETLDRLEEGLRTVTQQDEELVEVYQRAIASLRVVLGDSLR